MRVVGLQYRYCSFPPFDAGLFFAGNRQERGLKQTDLLAGCPLVLTLLVCVADVDAKIRTHEASFSHSISIEFEGLLNRYDRSVSLIGFFALKKWRNP
jgi:hypothetical protein